jgi:hypothetical protein
MMFTMRPAQQEQQISLALLLQLFCKLLLQQYCTDAVLQIAPGCPAATGKQRSTDCAAVSYPATQ